MIPLATALGENSKKERFDVVTRPEDRIVRICIGSAIFSFMAALLISFAMSETVTDQLRYNPNWFFPDGGQAPHESTGLARVNYEMSGTVADIVENTTRAIGIYEGTASQQEPSTPIPSIVRPPEPTRPATRPGTPASTRPGRGVQENKGTDDEKAVEDEAPANPSPAPTKSSAGAAETSGSERSTPPSRTRPAAPKEKGDYVRW